MFVSRELALHRRLAGRETQLDDAVQHLVAQVRRLHPLVVQKRDEVLRMLVVLTTRGGALAPAHDRDDVDQREEVLLSRLTHLVGDQEDVCGDLALVLPVLAFRETLELFRGGRLYGDFGHRILDPSLVRNRQHGVALPVFFVDAKLHWLPLHLLFTKLEGNTPIVK